MSSPTIIVKLSGSLDPSGFERFAPVPQNPEEVVVSAPYPDLSKVGRDGTREYLVTVRADKSVATVRFPDERAAEEFRGLEIDDLLFEAFS